MSTFSDLTLDDLRYLVALADAGSVSEAAKVLGVKQPSVSRRMDAWRKLRPPLVRKQGNRDVLTDRGHKVVSTARTIVQQFDHLTAYLRDQEDAPNVLYLASGSVASQWYLAPALARMSTIAPDCRFRTRVLRGAQRITGVAGGELDVAIVSHDAMQIEMIAGPGVLRVEPLADLSLCVVAHKDSEPAAEITRILKGQQVPLKLLTRWDLVGLDPQSGVRRFLERQLATSKDRLRFVAETGGWAGAKEYARCGLGVAILPLACIEPDDLEDLVARRLPSEVGVRHSIIARQEDQREAVAQVCQAIRDVARERAEKVQRQWRRVL